MPELDGLRATVLGLGRFGGGVGVTRWLAGQGARVIVSDRAPARDLQRSVDALDDLRRAGAVELRLGGHARGDVTGSDLLVVNPAVPRPWENELLRAARDAGVAITTEMRLLLERLDRRRVIGVTGSAGKSTTSAMIHHILLRTGHRAHLGGNIGGSLLPHVDVIAPDDWIVLELSSFMLYWLGAGADRLPELPRRDVPGLPGLSPHVALLTNLSPNHLDWHGSMAHYEASKRTIFRFQVPGDVALEPAADDAAAAPIPLALPGPHNQRNAAAAVRAAVRATAVDPAAATRALADFRPLPHRLEEVAVRDGRRFVNDSKSTTPDATVLAVASFPEPARIHLIAGGYDKESDLAPVADLAARVAAIYAIGATGGAIARLGAPLGRTRRCADLAEAVRAARIDMREGDVLLLSPGCASWDQFENYEARGRAFVEMVAGDGGDGRAARPHP